MLESNYVMLNARLGARLAKRVDGQLSYHGISFTEYTIMYHLEQAPHKTMRRIDLADCVSISASGVTRLLAPMEKNKLIEKEVNPRDARVSLVKLSKTGIRLFNEAKVSFEECSTSLTSELTPNQLEKLTELTNKLL